MSHKHVLGALSLSFGLMGGSSAQNLPPTNWSTQPGFLPTQATIKNLKGKLVISPGNWRGNRCVFENGLSIRPSYGYMPDNRTIYSAMPDLQKNCTLDPLVRMEGPTEKFTTAATLAKAIRAIDPFASAVLQGDYRSFAGNLVDQSALPVQIGPGPSIILHEQYADSLGLAKALLGFGPGQPIVLGDAPVVQASAQTGLPDRWWEQTGLVASSPQGRIQTQAGFLGQCMMRVGDNMPVSLPPGSIAITDARRAFYIDANCQAQPLVTLPATAPGNVNITRGSAGRWGLPMPTNPTPTAPATGMAINPATLSMMASGLAFLGMILNEGWQQLNGIIFKNGSDAESAWQNKQASGQNAEQIGEIGFGSNSPNFEKCRDQWISDTAQCDNQYKGRENIARHNWAHDELRRCLYNQPRQKFIP